MQGSYDKIIERISKSSGVEKEEIERRIEAKRAKLSGLISREGAAQVVAAELGVSFEAERLKIDELLPGMRKVNVVGKVINLFPVRTFTSKKGDEGKVVNFIMADETSNTKVVLWDTNHIALIESGRIKEGSVVEISNGTIRDNEIHLGSFSEFKPSSESIVDVVTEKIAREKPISDFRISDSAVSRAFVVQTFEPRFFYVCPECKKKVVSGDRGFVCAEHSVVNPEKRALMNFVLDDGTENIRAVLFHEALKSIGFDDLENVEAIIEKRNDLLGREMVFHGNVRMNKFFNNPEFIVDNVNPLDLDEMIAKLEK